MKEIEVKAWCDAYHPEGHIAAPNEVTLSLNGHKPVVLDLCDKDHEDLLAMIAAGGTVPEAVKAKTPGSGRKPMPGPHICPVCGTEHASRNAMTKHLRAAHKTSIKELAEAAQT